MSNEATRLRDIVRSKDPMHNLCKERLITPEACDWVKTALDPFHDMQIEHLRGYPDVATEPTVVVKIRQALTVSRPPGLPEGDNWDCHIVLSPIDYSPGCTDTAPVACAAFPGGLGCEGGAHYAGCLLPSEDYLEGFRTGRLDGLVINSVKSDSTDGANMTFTPTHLPKVGANGYEVQNLTLDNYLDFEDTDLGVYRLIYSGFEVVNTTAQIHKQGAVTVYEYGNSYEMAASQPRVFQTNSQTPLCPQGMYSPTTYFRQPPNTLAEAKIMPGAHSWAAQEGCYNTAKFQSENPFQAITKRNWVLCQNNPSQPSGESGYLRPDDPFWTNDMTYRCGSIASDVDLLDYRNTDNPTKARQTGPSHFSRMNTTGAYFTGLSYETTLFVTWRVGIERLPSANKPAFLALAQPSASFDPNALVLYNMIANVLPPGCPQGYNDAGSWFRWISEAAKKSIPAVYPVVRTASLLASSMGRPLLANALGGAANAMKPVAQDISARRLQKAVRAKQARKKAASAPKKQAVKNWSQPSMRGTRKGGTNGLK